MKKEKINSLIFTMFSFVVLGCIVAIMMLYLYKYFMLEMDDDNAAEMILSWILHRDGGIISKDWIYSTEIRVINIQIIYSILFNFFSNWLTVRVIGNGIMYVILIGTVYYLCNQLRLKKYFLVLGIMFLIPMCRDYYVYTLHSAYMLPHLTLSMLIMAIFLHTGHIVGWKRITILCVGGILSILAGMGGLRLVFLLFIPLIIASLFCIFREKSEYNKNALISACIISICGFVGYFFNALYLTRVYDNSSVSDARYSLFQIDNLLKVFNAFIKNYGWHYENSLFSIQTYYNILPVVLIVVIITICYSVFKCKRKICKEHEFIIVFYVLAMIIFCLLYAFSYMTLYDRYLMPITCYGYFLFWIFIDNSVKRVSAKKVIGTLFVLYYISYGILNLYEYSKVDTSGEIRKISSILVENQYFEGYSNCYWHEGNALTECSSGQIKVWRLRIKNIDENAVGKFMLDEKLNWLCSKSQYDRHPQGKVFLILSNELRCLNDGVLIYENSEENIFIYGYDSYDELILDIDK